MVKFLRKVAFVAVAQAAVQDTEAVKLKPNYPSKKEITYGVQGVVALGVAALQIQSATTPNAGQAVMADKADVQPYTQQQLACDEDLSTIFQMQKHQKELSQDGKGKSAQSYYKKLYKQQGKWAQYDWNCSEVDHKKKNKQVTKKLNRRERQRQRNITIKNKGHQRKN